MQAKYSTLAVANGRGDKIVQFISAVSYRFIACTYGAEVMVQADDF